MAIKTEEEMMQVVDGWMKKGGTNELDWEVLAAVKTFFAVNEGTM